MRIDVHFNNGLFSVQTAYPAQGKPLTEIWVNDEYFVGAEDLSELLEFLRSRPDVVIAHRDY